MERELLRMREDFKSLLSSEVPSNILHLLKGVVAYNNYFWGQHLLKTSSSTKALSVHPDSALLGLGFSCIN